MRTQMRGLLGLAVALTALVASLAQATTVRSVDLATLARTSEAVVVGEVVSLRSYIGARGAIFTEARVQPERVRGVPRAGAVHVTVHGGVVDDRAMVVHGQARFSVGERVVVFLVRAGERYFPNAMAQGKWGVVNDTSGVAYAFRTSHGVDGESANAAEVMALEQLWRIVAGEQAP